MACGGRIVDDLEVRPDWMVVLPDVEGAGSVVAASAVAGGQRIDHASGRPWILGRWANGALAWGAAGGARVAMVGEHGATAEVLTRVAARLRSVTDLDGALATEAARPAGSYHVVASVAGDVRVQGTLSSLRPVHCTTVGGVTIAADGADVLADVVGAPLDEGRLALRLLVPQFLHPLSEEPVWGGVTPVPMGHHLVLDRHGRSRFVRHWRAPEPELPMAEGAPLLREALVEAVEVRLPGHDVVSSDLSGLDSTSLCCLAARAGAPLVAYTADLRDPLADDVRWAGRTVAELAGVEHHVLPARRFPLHYGHLAELGEPGDEPCAATVDRDRWLVVVRAAAARGSTLHFAGFGGDELLWGSPAHLHGMFRTTPRTAVRHLRGFATLRRWPYRQALRMVADRRSYGTWLEEVADRLTAPVDADEVPPLGWGRPPRLPPWATEPAVDLVRALVRSVAPGARPAAPLHGLHQELVWVRTMSRVVRRLGHAAAREGVRLATPYYDDAVIEAALRVRPQDRISPWRYKPLAAAAMTGIVPAVTLGRTTKDDGGHDAATGRQEHRAELLALWEGARLGELGLVDVGALREASARPLPPALPASLLDQTVACEVWLRSRERRAPVVAGPGHPATPANPRNPAIAEEAR
jgi:asparagine synthase (glutamine-hydrolysing)